MLQGYVDCGLAVWAALGLVAAVARSVYRHRAQHAFARKHGCRPAQSRAPVKDPIIGLDFVYDVLFGDRIERHLESTMQKFKNLGPTYVVSRWSKELVYSCDSRNIKQILSTSFDDYSLPQVRVSALESLVGRGIFTLDGQSWSHARSVLKPMVAALDKDAMFEVLETKFKAMVGLMPVDDSPVSLQPLFFRLAMDFSADYLMGGSTCMLENDGCPGDRAMQFVADYMVCSTEVIDRLAVGPLHCLRINRDALRARAGVFSFIDGFIADSLRSRRRKGIDRRPDLLSRLAAVTTDRKVLRDQVLHMLVASRDTVASLLSNLFFVLARSPQVYQRLREEALAVAGTAPPSASQLKQAEYSRWCINESLRLHPVIPTNARQAKRDTALPRGGGPDGNSPLLVTEGTVVLFNVYAMHRDERVFGGDIEAFVPERWRGLRPGWGYLPFGGGPRICMGQHAAVAEAQYVLLRMAQTFESIEGVGEQDWVEQYALATACRDSVGVRLRRT